MTYNSTTLTLTMAARPGGSVYWLHVGYDVPAYTKAWYVLAGLYRFSSPFAYKVSQLLSA